MSNLNTTFDNDFDSFLNLESNDFTPIVSPATKSIPSLAHQNSQQSFSGPTYQYDSYRQQTGLPMGGLANAFAVNQASGMHYRPNSMGYVMPTETLNIPLASNLDDFDFNRNQSMDMDFEADSPSDVSSMFYGGESSQSAPIKRIYPGMHSQQAAQAKAAQAMKQQAMQQPTQLPGQQSLPTQSAKAPAAKDPHVEESISRLLNRMRQSSSASAGDDDANSNAGGMNMTKTKKEEDDMDDDERLLASEEGKKLSSKERRQLRNKVSARAFRSRRKEYITQLEAEVQQKVQEANDLRVQNRQLMEENTRLTDLSRMLLSSQAFSGFLQELSNSGLPAPQIPVSATSTNQSSQVRKDVGAHEAARQLQSQNQPQVNLVSIPEASVTMGGLDNWNSMPTSDFQVFALTTMPQPPALDLEAMSEKVVSKSPVKPALELPSLPPSIETTEESKQEPQGAVMTTSDSTDCDLYGEPINDITTSVTTQSVNSSAISPKSSSAILPAQVITSQNGSWSQLRNLCAELDETCQRISMFLPARRE